MSKAAGKNLHFQEERGDFSTRINANGDYKHLASEPVVFQGYLAQTQKIYEEICRMKKIPCMSPEEKAVFENHVREYGSRQKMLREATHSAFERIFIHVAQGLLPAKWFMVINEEARQLWRHNGFASEHIVDMKKARKHARKVGVKRYWKTLNNLKRSNAINCCESDFEI